MLTNLELQMKKDPNRFDGQVQLMSLCKTEWQRNVHNTVWPEEKVPCSLLAEQ